MRTYLLDTCALLWWMADAPELGAGARRAIGNRRNRIVVSVASLWEIAIKRRKGRLAGVDQYLARYTELHATWGFSTVVIEPADAVAAGALSLSHEDPFDRMILVQSRRLGAPIVTCDETMRQHAPGCVW
jgi:PIN domain nuclease of toxin-antitoxin system